MTCTECGTKCVKTDPGVYECPGCANIFTKPAKLTATKRQQGERLLASTRETIARLVADGVPAGDVGRVALEQAAIKLAGRLGVQ